MLDDNALQIEQEDGNQYINDGARQLAFAREYR
jgi:hypothetical protein